MQLVALRRDSGRHVIAYIRRALAGTVSSPTSLLRCDHLPLTAPGWTGRYRALVGYAAARWYRWRRGP